MPELTADDLTDIFGSAAPSPVAPAPTNPKVLTVDDLEDVFGGTSVPPSIPFHIRRPVVPAAPPVDSGETQGWVPPGLAGALNSANEIYPAAAHGVAGAFNTGVAGARRFGYSAIDAALNAPGSGGSGGYGDGYGQYLTAKYNPGTNAPAPLGLAPREMSQLATDDPIGQLYQDAAAKHAQQLEAINSPLARSVGHGAEIGTNLATAIADPFLMAPVAMGTELNRGRSMGGAAAVGALNLLPGRAGKLAEQLVTKGLTQGARILPQAAQFPVQVVANAPIVASTAGQAALGTAMAGGTALESQLFEDPQLAKEDADAIAMSGGVGGLLGLLMSRGRVHPGTGPLRDLRPTTEPAPIDVPIAPGVEPVPPGVVAYAERSGLSPGTKDKPSMMFPGGPSSRGPRNPIDPVSEQSRPLTEVPEPPPGVDSYYPPEVIARMKSNPVERNLLSTEDPLGILAPERRPGDISPEFATTDPAGTAPIVTASGTPRLPPMELKPEDAYQTRSRRPGETDPDMQTQEISPEIVADLNRRAEAADRAQYAKQMERAEQRSRGETPEWKAQREEWAAQAKRDSTPEARAAEEADLADIRARNQPPTETTTGTDTAVEPAGNSRNLFDSEAAPAPLASWFNDLAAADKMGSTPAARKPVDIVPESRSTTEPSIAPIAPGKASDPVESHIRSLPEADQAAAREVVKGWDGKSDPKGMIANIDMAVNGPRELAARKAARLAAKEKANATPRPPQEKAPEVPAPEVRGEAEPKGESRTDIAPEQSSVRPGKPGETGSRDVTDANGPDSVRTPVDTKQPSTPGADLGGRERKTSIPVAAIRDEFAREGEARGLISQMKGSPQESLKGLLKEYDSLPPEHRKVFDDAINGSFGEGTLPLDLYGDGSLVIKTPKQALEHLILPEVPTSAKAVLEEPAGGYAQLLSTYLAYKQRTGVSVLGVPPSQNLTRRGAAINPIDEVAKLADKGVDAIGRVANRVSNEILDGEGIASVPAKALRTYEASLEQVVGRKGGEVGKEFAARAFATNNRARQLEGELAPLLRKAQETVSSTSKKGRQTANKLMELKWDGDFATARSHLVAEGKTEPSASEAAWAKAHQDLFYASGKQAEDAGVMQRQANGKEIPFRADKNRKEAIRAPEDALHYYADHPGIPDARKLFTHVAEKNDMTLEEFEKLAKTAFGERSLERPAALEQARGLKYFPTHMKTTEGEVVPLLKSNPLKMVEALATRTPQRVAFHEKFGGEDPKVGVAEYEKAGGDRAAAENLFLALSGSPIEAPGTGFKPGSGLDTFSRRLGMFMSALRASSLSVSAAVNVPESIAKTFPMAGAKTYVRAVKSLFRHPKDAQQEMENIGAMAAHEFNWHLEPGRKGEQVERIMRDVLGMPLHAVEQKNVTLSALAGYIKAGDLKAGKGTMFDRVRLNWLGFKKPEIDALMSGKATPEQYQAVATRYPEWTQGHATKGSENSRIAHSKWYQRLVIAERFPRMTVNRFARAAKSIPELWKQGEKGQAAAAVALLTGMGLTHAASGAAGLLIRSALMWQLGSATSSLLQGEDKTNAWKDFLWKSLAGALFGPSSQAVGTVGAMAAGLGENDKSIPAVLASPIYPLSVVENVVNFSMAMAGKDAPPGSPFKDLSRADAAVKFLEMRLPLTKVAANAAGALGLGERDPEMDGAMSAFWNWRRKYAPFEGANGATQYSEFRIAAKKAARMVQDGKDPTPYLEEALQAKVTEAPERQNAAEQKARMAGKDYKRPDARTEAFNSLTTSLMSRRVLDDLTPEQKKAAADYLGPATFERLSTYDQLLEAWAKRLKDAR